MQGRLVLVAKALVSVAGLWMLVGCQPPRIKSMESAQAATTSNPPRDFKKAPLDPYSWGGIAMASGGRDTRTTYGALSPNGDGANEVYLPVAPNPPAKTDDTAKIYLVPDPRGENKVGQRLGSVYLDNEGNDITPKTVEMNPPRADLAKPQPKPAAGTGE